MNVMLGYQIKAIFRPMRTMCKILCTCSAFIAASEKQKIWSMNGAHHNNETCLLIDFMCYCFQHFTRLTLHAINRSLCWPTQRAYLNSFRLATDVSINKILSSRQMINEHGFWFRGIDTIKRDHLLPMRSGSNFPRK